MTRDDGGPAFPVAEIDERAEKARGINRAQPGMSLRDWFAGQALMGLLASERIEWEKASAAAFAQDAYDAADALLAQRSK